eukprot:scaffold71290_cov14-Tisochrysis_lutea.AAC.1
MTSSVTSASNTYQWLVIGCCIERIRRLLQQSGLYPRYLPKTCCVDDQQRHSRLKNLPVRRVSQQP